AKEARTIREKAEKRQVNLFVGHLGIARTDPDFVALEVMDNVFGVGAGFTDRLSKNIRDEKGLAYTVFGDITRTADVAPGMFRVYCGTSPESADLALAEMRKEIAAIRDRAPTPEELEGAKAALRGGMVFRCETSADLARVLVLCERFGLGFDYPKRYLEALDKVTAEDVQRVAKAHIDPAALIEVRIG
ncbi:MAG: M16 family metallopeptidase, partial [Planctomycetota bacterium]